MSPDVEKSSGIDRRTLIKRGAVLGGALVWTVPTVQSIASPAFAAAGSPPTPACSFTFSWEVSPGVGACLEVDGATSACCQALNTAAGLPNPTAQFIGVVLALLVPCAGAASTVTDC